MKLRRILVSLTIITALLVQTFGPAFAQSTTQAAPAPTTGGNSSGNSSGQSPQFFPVGRTRINLMEPIQNVISGSAWLLATGRDIRPRPNMQEGFFLNREAVGKMMSAPFSPANAPALQGGGAGLLVPYRDPAPAFSRNILMSRDFSGRTLQTEPDIAVDPLDPDHIVVGTIDYNFPSNSAYVTFDGGANWQGPIQTKYLREDLGGAGDPVVKFDSKGTVYMASISLGFDEYQIGAAAGETLISSIALASSTDGGLTWGDPVSTARSGISFEETPPEEGSSGGGGIFGGLAQPRGKLKVSFLDKPWMAIGPHPTIEDQDVIYVSYVKFTTVYDIIYLGELPILGAPVAQSVPELVYSTDGGQTWSDPVEVGPVVQRLPGEEGKSEAVNAEMEEGMSDPAKDAREQIEKLAVEQKVADGGNLFQQGAGEAEGNKRVVQGVTPAVDSKGNVYVFWFDSTDDDSQKGLGELYMAKSEDGAATWAKPKKIASFLEPGFRPRNAYFRYWASVFPKVAVGPKDELFITFTALPLENPLDEGDVFFIRSIDGGSKWTRPKKLNTDETDAPQFFPAITVSPNGTLHVMWGDMRDDAVQARYHIYYTSSSDNGDTWGFKNEELGLDVGDTRVTDFPTNANKAFPDGVFIGDYFSIAATDDDAYMVWADGRLGEYGGFNQKIGFARKRQVSNPEVFISPDTGPGGETVTVQGFGFQPNINYYLQVGEQTVTTGRVNDKGEMTANVYIPISGEGAHPIALVDDSGNVASTSFYMDYGFNTIKNDLEALDSELDELRASAATTASTQGGDGGIQQIRSNVIAQTGNASLSAERVANLEAQVQALSAKLDVQPTIDASGGFTATTPLALTLVGLAGLLIGAALSRLRKSA